MKLNIELTVDEANVILTSLGKMPYDQVMMLISKIRGQAQEQIDKAEAVAKANKE